MRNILLTISYCGTAYHGWQIQENANTVQSEIQNACIKIFGSCPDIKGCSRTDTGVHARMFCLNFHKASNIRTEKIPDAFNHFLPSDIAVYNAKEVSEDFHARYSCKGKEYEYLILNSRYPNPFLENRAFRYSQHLDENLLDKAARGFCGTYDFRTFCSSGTSVNDFVRTIYSANVTRDGDIVKFNVSGNGFLYNMVRIMAGTLIYVNEGKILCDDIPKIINSLDRKKAGITLAPEGLYLNKVFY